MLVSLVMCSFSMTSEAADDGSGTGETVDPGNVVTYKYSKTVNNVTTEYTMNYIIDTESMTADVYGFPENVDKSVTKIRIPGTITVDEKEYVVMDIAPNAFKDNDWLKTVTIEDNGSSDKRVVGENAFANASALYLLNYPVNSVGGGFVSIGDGAFSGTALTSPNFQKIAFIGTDAFKDCTKLTSANINNVTEIGDGAFSGCTSLKTVNAKVLTKAGANAFSGCTALKTVNAQELTNVGVGVFSRCTALTDVSLGECDSVLELFKDSAKLEYITIAGVYHPIVNGSIGEYDDTNSLFKIGSNYYPTLATALSNLDDGEKLMLLKNLEVSSVSIENVDDFIFDLGGKTLTLTSYDGLSLLNSTGVLQNGDVVSTFNGKSEKEEAVAIRLTVLCELTVSGVDVVIQSTSKDATWNNSGFVLESQSKLTMENGSTVSSELSDAAYGSVGVVILGPGSEKTSPTELIINKGVSITVGQYGISGNGSIILEDDIGDDTGSGEQGTGVTTQDEGGDPASVKKDFRNTSITISGANVSAKYGWGIYHPQIGTLVVKDGAIISGVTGIEMRSGSLTVDGATITADEDYRSDSTSEASSVYGAAIAVAPYRSADELGTVTVNIVDGNFEGGVAFAQSNPDKVTDPGFDFSISGGTFTSNGTDTTTQSTYPAVVTTEDEIEERFITGGTFKSGTENDDTLTDYVDSAYDLIDGTVVVDKTASVATIGNRYYSSLASAIADAGENDVIYLFNDVNENITIPSGKTIILDLNGNMLQSPVDSTEDLIVVESGGNLTIWATDGGTVDCTVNGRACLVNNGTVVIEGGDFIRSKQAFDTEYPATGGSWKHTHYVIENDGTMRIEGGSFIMGFKNDSTEGGYYLGNVSSVITNGQTNTSGSAKLTINGGDFIGAANIVKNNSGVLTITDGTFTMDNRAHRWVGGNNMVQNAPDSTMNITGGDFYAYGYGGAIDDDDWARNGIYNSGTANVSGITLTMEGQYSNGIVQSTSATGNMSLRDSTVTVDVNDPTSHAIVANDSASDRQLTISSGTYTGTIDAASPELQITGGTYSEDVSDYLPTGLGMEQDENGNYVVTAPVRFDVDSIGVFSDSFRLPVTIAEGATVDYQLPNGFSIKGDLVTISDSVSEGTYKITATSTVAGVVHTATLSVTVEDMGIASEESGVDLIIVSSAESKGEFLERYDEMVGVPDGVLTDSDWLIIDVSRVDGLTDPVSFSITVPGLSETDGVAFYAAHFGITVDNPECVIDGDSLIITPSSFSTFAIVPYLVSVDPDPEPTPDPGWNPGWDDDDDYVPPIYVPSGSSSSDDDTVKIVACAAAAVVAAIMAAFLILGHRRE